MLCCNYLYTVPDGVLETKINGSYLAKYARQKEHAKFGFLFSRVNQSKPLQGNA